MILSKLKSIKIYKIYLFIVVVAMMAMTLSGCSEKVTTKWEINKRDEDESQIEEEVFEKKLQTDFSESDFYETFYDAEGNIKNNVFNEYATKGNTITIHDIVLSSKNTGLPGWETQIITIGKYRGKIDTSSEIVETLRDHTLDKITVKVKLAYEDSKYPYYDIQELIKVENAKKISMKEYIKNKSKYDDLQSCILIGDLVWSDYDNRENYEYYISNEESNSESYLNLHTTENPELLKYIDEHMSSIAVRLEKGKIVEVTYISGQERMVYYEIKMS